MPLIAIKGYGNVSFPDTMEQDAIKSAIDKLISGESKPTLTPQQKEEDLMHKATSTSYPKPKTYEIPDKPLIGNPLAGFNYAGPQVSAIREGVKRGGRETAELWEQGKPGQAYLHSLGTLGGAVGGAVMAPLAAASPQAAEMSKQALATMFEQRQPGEPEPGIPYSPYGVGPATGVRIGAGRPTQAKTLAELAQEHPTATRIVGDVLSTAGAIPIAKAPALAVEQTGKQIIKPLGRAIKESAIKTNVPKVIAPDIEALRASASKKFIDDIGTKDVIKQKKAIEDIVIKHGLDKFIRNKDQFQSKALDAAYKASNRADEEALKAFYPQKVIREEPSKKFITKTMEGEKPKQLNPWKVAEDAIFEEKNLGPEGAFSGVNRSKIERAYRTLQKDWASTYNKPKNLEELIRFKRNVLNKDGDLFKKTTDIPEKDPGEIQVKKLIYHKLNDEIAKISPEYKKFNKESKDLHNIAEAAAKYAPYEKPSIAGKAGAAIGTSVGGGAGYMAGKSIGGYPGGAIGGALGASTGGTLGALAGRKLAGTGGPVTSLKESIGRGLESAGEQLSTRAGKAELPKGRYEQFLSDITDVGRVPGKREVELSKIAPNKQYITVESKEKVTKPIVIAREISKEEINPKKVPARPKTGPKTGLRSEKGFALVPFGGGKKLQGGVPKSEPYNFPVTKGLREELKSKEGKQFFIDGYVRDKKDFINSIDPNKPGFSAVYFLEAHSKGYSDIPIKIGGVWKPLGQLKNYLKNNPGEAPLFINGPEVHPDILDKFGKEAKNGLKDAYEEILQKHFAEGGK
jgi:hypothetical protein